MIYFNSVLSMKIKVISTDTAENLPNGALKVATWRKNQEPERKAHIDQCCPLLRV